jgi:hypothetical protein
VKLIISIQWNYLIAQNPFIWGSTGYNLLNPVAFYFGQANSLTGNLSLQSAFVKQNPIDIIELFCPKPVFLNYLGQK